eukprot:398554_1
MGTTTCRETPLITQTQSNYSIQLNVHVLDYGCRTGKVPTIDIGSGLVPTEDAYCDTIISGTLELHRREYLLQIYNLTYVNFVSCLSEADIKITIFDFNGDIISDDYCNNGDHCGSCHQSNNTYSENFTIPMSEGSYIISIEPYREYTQYVHNEFKLTIDCMKTAPSSSMSRLHYTNQITESLFLNFTPATRTTWVSDGINISYDLSVSHSDVPIGSYHIPFQIMCSGTITKFHLNTSNDNCTCIDYNCHHCYFHLGLHMLSSLVSGNFWLLYLDSAAAVISQKVMFIELQKCKITFNVNRKMLNNIIVFNFTLSNECYERIGKSFTMDIFAPDLNISSLFGINIGINKTSEGFLCENISLYSLGNINGNCMKCDEGKFNTLIIKQVESIKDNFDIHISPYSVDLLIDPSIFPISAILAATSITNNKMLYSVITSFFIIIILAFVFGYIYFRRQYNKAYVVDNALVLLIGVSQFNDRKKFLPGVKQNIDKLQNLWENYHYDVFIIKQDTLDATKAEIIHFIDEIVQNTLKLKNDYKCVIVHCISHGDSNSLLCSDGNKLCLDFICHELSDVESEKKYDMIKIIYHHTCRGENDYHDFHTNERPSAVSLIHINGRDNNEISDVSANSNLITIYGNIDGRSLSDQGDFTRCICKTFNMNLQKSWWMKRNFNSLITEIGWTLEQATNKAELCNVNGTLRYDNIRFDKSK